MRVHTVRDRCDPHGRRAKGDDDGEKETMFQTRSRSGAVRPFSGDLTCGRALRTLVLIQLCPSFGRLS